MKAGPEAIRKMIGFGDAVEDSTAGQYKVLKRDYLPEGRIPVIDQGQAFIAGYTNNDKAIFTGELPVVLFGDHTLAFKYVDFPFVLGADGVKVLSINKAFNPKYVFYYWRSRSFQSRGYSRHFKYLREMELPLIPLSEQRRIVEILDQADALRKKRVEADAKAARILQALFYKMFGDPATNPKGWPMACLGDVTVDLRYGTSVKCGVEAGRWPVLRIPNVLGGHIDLNELKYADLPESDVEKLRLEDGDILFVRTNGNRDYVGRCAVFQLAGDFLFASYLIRARLDQGKADPKFIRATLGTPVGRKAMSPYIRTTAGQSNISQEGLRQIPLILPPLDIQIRFCRLVDDLNKAERQRYLMAQKVEVLFQTLLHRAFTGNLTAKWREAHMKELLAEMEQQTKALGGQSSL